MTHGDSPLTVQTTPAPEIAELTQGAAEVLPHGGLEAKLKERAGKPLRVKLGFDPTKPDLHIGHAVVLNALRRFQDKGHQVVIIIGDFTATIGDPTGKEATRPPLSTDEVNANAKTYLEQLGLVLDLSKTEVRYNSEWLAKMSMVDCLKLTAQTTVAQMLARDNFAKRYERNDPIGLHEFMYPLLQGHDSVVIDADIEMGGTDQKFNNLMGRQLQESAGKPAQVVMLYPILEGTDGVQKMSKSLNNYIGLTDAPEDMYGKVMSVPDALLENYYRLASCLSLSEIEETLAGYKAGTLHPRDAKMRLARAIVSRYHGPEAGQRGEDAFVRQFQQRQIPDDMPEVTLASLGLEGDTAGILALLSGAKLVASTSEARRLIQQGGIKLHQGDEATTVSDPQATVAIPAEGLIIQVGKRRFARISRG
ncbi:tyrosine--tRNA ligase [bacterium]|nr:tyrosine--tRNA ligase [bacterium]